MGNPVRFTAGFTQDFSFQPLGQCGFPNPFFYAVDQDDFLPFNSGNYTITKTTGTLAATTTNGVGGRILFTTAATLNDFVSMQAGANFQVATPKKLVALCRIQVADITNSAFLFGLIETTATPFAPTDGFYIEKAAAGTSLSLHVVKGSTSQGTVTIPATLAANTDIDLGIFLDRLGNVWAYAGASMVGQQPNQNASALGPQAGLLAANLGTLTTAMLAPTLAVQAGTAVAQTGVADFILAAQER